MTNSVFGLPVPAAQSGSAPVQGRKEFKKVDAYLNIGLARADGKDGQIGGTGIRLFFNDEDPSVQQLAELLQTDEGVEWFRQNMTIRCNITAGPKSGFVLPTA